MSSSGLITHISRPGESGPHRHLCPLRQAVHSPSAESRELVSAASPYPGGTRHGGYSLQVGWGGGTRARHYKSPLTQNQDKSGGNSCFSAAWGTSARGWYAFSGRRVHPPNLPAGRAGGFPPPPAPKDARSTLHPEITGRETGSRLAREDRSARFVEPAGRRPARAAVGPAPAGWAEPGFFQRDTPFWDTIPVRFRTQHMQEERPCHDTGYLHSRDSA